MVRRFVVWRGLEQWAAESARIELGDDGLRATGTQFGADPLPYRADYALDATGPGFTTRHLRVAVAGEGWRRTLDLLRDDDGWRWTADGEGTVELPAPGGDLTALGAEARDCDLALSPLTNLMPIRRRAFHLEPGQEELRVAWVSLPDLAIHVSGQRYAHVRAGVVHFSDLDGFSAEIEVDDDGLVRRYPRIAERV